MTKQQITYEGPSSIFCMCIQDPDIWNKYYGWMIEDIAPIWEKIYIKQKKLTKYEQDFISIHDQAFKAYTALVHLYYKLPEQKKDQLASEWNRKIKKWN